MLCSLQHKILCCWWFRLLGAEAREAAGRVSEANRLPRALFNHQRVERDAGYTGNRSRSPSPFSNSMHHHRPPVFHGLNPFSLDRFSFFFSFFFLIIIIICLFFVPLLDFSVEDNASFSFSIPFLFGIVFISADDNLL